MLFNYGPFERKQQAPIDSMEIDHGRGSVRGNHLDFSDGS
jgi:hypothetical protein